MNKICEPPLPIFKWRAWYEKEINSVDEVLEMVERSVDNAYYRGMSKKEYICITSFFRYYCENHNLEQIEVKVDRSDFRTMTLPQIDESHYLDLSFKVIELFRIELEKRSHRSSVFSYASLVYLAQHYGLPTNLLDFSLDAKVALYFACCDDYDNDAVLYESNIYEIVSYCKYQFSTSPYRIAIDNGGCAIPEAEIIDTATESMMNLKERCRNIVIPIIKEGDISFNQRIVQQKGHFVYYPYISPYDQLMFNISNNTYHPARRVYIIKADLKKKILDKLKNSYGIDKNYLYPKSESDLNKELLVRVVRKTKNKLNQYLHSGYTYYQYHLDK